MLDRLTYESAREMQGTSFWAYPETDHRVELRVVEVAKVMESEAALLKRTAFSIFMLGPGSYPLKQGTFAMTHETAAEPFEMFVVPVEQRGEDFLYEAVFT